MNTPQAPNIVLITTDQQRHDTVAPWAPAFLRTPHTDRLQREGVNFAAAYAQCPLCTPTRLSILTGQSPARSGIQWFDYPPLADEAQTLPARLRRRGYQTAAIGKMHFHPHRARHGFDEMIITEDYYRAMARAGHPQQPMRHGLGQNEVYPTCSTVPEALSITNWIADQSVEYLVERRDPTRPFFLWCSFSKPHPPFDPPEPYYSMYRHSPIPEPVFGDWSRSTRCPEALKRMREQMSFDQVPPEVVREMRSAYYGLVTQCDYQMGRVLGALAEAGQYDNTLILFTSDHGDYLGDFGNGAKNLFHEPASHVPFVMVPPRQWGEAHHGRTVDQPVTHTDILPTCLAAAGDADAAGGEGDGQDLLALVRGDLARPRRYVDGICETNPPSKPAAASLRAWAGLTDGRWKYIWYPEGGLEQLFDLHTDPREERDLAQEPQQASQKQRLRDALIEIHQQPHYHRQGFVRDGQLQACPLRGDSTNDRRAQSWPAIFTGLKPSDAKH